MTGWCQVLGDKTKVYSHKSNWPKISDQEGEKNKMSWRQTVLSIIFHSIIYWRTFKFFSRFLTFVPKLQSMDWSTLLILLSIGLRDSFGLPWLQWVRQKIYGWMSNCHYFFFSALYFQYELMIPIYEKYQESKTITSIKTTNYPVWNINFPGVTICSNNKVSKSRLS